MCKCWFYVLWCSAERFATVVLHNVWSGLRANGSNSASDELVVILKEADFLALCLWSYCLFCFFCCWSKNCLLFCIEMDHEGDAGVSSVWSWMISMDGMSGPMGLLHRVAKACCDVWLSWKPLDMANLAVCTYFQWSHYPGVWEPASPVDDVMLCIKFFQFMTVKWWFTVRGKGLGSTILGNNFSSWLWTDDVWCCAQAGYESIWWNSNDEVSLGSQIQWSPYLFPTMEVQGWGGWWETEQIQWDHSICMCDTINEVFNFCIDEDLPHGDLPRTGHITLWGWQFSHLWLVGHLPCSAYCACLNNAVLP